MTIDPFTEAARAEAERRWPRLPQDPSGHYLSMGKRVGFDLGARWARDHLAAHDARVRRDAAREALLALDLRLEPLGRFQNADGIWEAQGEIADMLTNDYPEETP